MEIVGDMTYLGYVIQEALRRIPPIAMTSPLHFEQDVKLGGKYTIKAYDWIILPIYQMHHDSTQWQRPFDFIPDRFDISHPISKTPSG